MMGKVWTKEKPTAPGAYWVRGFAIGFQAQEGLVEVRLVGGKMCSNIHERNTDEDCQMRPISKSADHIEWCGPLVLSGTHSDDLDDDAKAEMLKLVRVLQGWHENATKQLQQIVDNDGASMQVGEITVEAKSDLARGIRFGVGLSLDMLGKLPFTLQGCDDGDDE